MWGVLSPYKFETSRFVFICHFPFFPLFENYDLRTYDKNLRVGISECGSTTNNLTDLSFKLWIKYLNERFFSVFLLERIGLAKKLLLKKKFLALKFSSLILDDKVNDNEVAKYDNV